MKAYCWETSTWTFFRKHDINYAYNNLFDEFDNSHNMISEKCVFSVAGIYCLLQNCKVH